ncbi:putative 3-hydroxybutyryl-CoA dehydrogenase [Gordonia hirsuta DSM 44140 = NBRC 16056]|uniref:Putative 3-hydroxybutyryl-CoA dehydrogenase n=1 Tax=Gordonia hirsuta DSM 44140 = NBRC 16056 TaxID=1121927 RepID=L7L8C7_9ACTN|nr:3-hydroxyacyl-CoA dehydrogenase [Gordonia hirsuta]GAC56312.1 putative 3-hydroxybutyryl-CoA dehydrogenase [Gordonia hirsuta DSM 44140 = NBRC 16056]
MGEIKKVLVLGTGVLGSQIAYQTAYSGFDVAVYDISDEVIGKARDTTFPALAQTYLSQVKGATQESVDAALARLSYHSDMASAAADIDIAIEAVPEVPKIKEQVFGELNKVAPEQAIFCTNSSTLLPSELAPYTGRPDRFLALHFANRVWQFNTAEVMGTPQTDQAVFDRVVEFAKQIGMVPIPLHKEKSGYVLNSLLVPFLSAAAELAEGGYADPSAVDDVWRIATGAPLGPFQIYDIIGLNTPYNIMIHGDAEQQKLGRWLKENYIDKGYLGLAAGRGFYDYSGK